MEDGKWHVKVKEISKKFSNIEKLKQCDETGEPAHWNLAYNVVEILGICEQINSILESKEEHNSESLFELSEEIRHLKYHVNDIKVFSHIE